MRRSLLVALVLVACSGAPANETVPEPGPTVAPTTTPMSTTQVEVVSTTTTTVATTTTTEPELEPFMPGLDLVEISTYGVGDDDRPLLSWDAVPDADLYTVLVLNEEGNPWWSWSGTETEVILGGVETDAEIGGPRAGPGIEWVVFAFDEEHRLLAVSSLVPTQ